MPLAPPPAGPAAWDAFVEEFLDSYFTAHPDVAVWAGRHEFDGRLPDWSADALTAEARRLRSERECALTFDSALLNERQRLEREYLIARVDHDLFGLESAQLPYRNPTFYANALDPNVYVMREYAPLVQRARAYTEYARAVPAAVERIRANLRTPLPRTYCDIGVTAFGGLAAYYETDVPGVFAPVEDAGLQAELRAANDGAVQAMRALEAWFEAQREEATADFALGPDLFREMLWATERVNVPLERLEERGQQDLERNLAALREACAALAPEKSVAECVAEVQARKPGEGPVAAARRQLTGLKRFVLAEGLVTVPGDEEARVDESPPYMRWNSAYIDIPGPYERNLPATYYITPPDANWSQAERESYLPCEADLLFVSAHEVWPGHFLQFLHSNRSASRIGRVFVGYAFAEGWAHYAEEMMWEAGLGRGDPETRIGQLRNALLRDVRYLAAIGLHTRGTSVEQVELTFREQAFLDPANARQQAARGTFDPGYLNYTLGKLMIRKLRDDWTGPCGGRDAWRAFHDQLLSYGGPPIPLVRAAMLRRTDGSLL